MLAENRYLTQISNSNFKLKLEFKKLKSSPYSQVIQDYDKLTQGRSELAPKGSNSKVPPGQFLRSLQFLRRSELAPQVINSEVPAGEFRANEV